MTNTERRVANAINATAQQITADSIPPFLASELTQPGVSRPSLGTRRRAGWLVPAASAMSVAIIATAALVIGNDLAGNVPSAGGAFEAVRPYYAKVTLEGPVSSNTPVAVTIRATATGKVLATVPSPAPRFVIRLVSAGTDDRTFVLAATQSGLAPPALAAVRFYSLGFDPATDAVSVSQLPISNVTVNTEDVSLQVALSPDGRSLAVITSTFNGIRLYSLPTGDQRTWTAEPGEDLLGPAWAGGSGGLAFLLRPVGLTAVEPGAYLLDTASHRHSLFAASHLLPAVRGSGCSPPWLLPNPTVMVCTVARQAHHVTKAYVAEISIRTGKLLRRIPLPGIVQNDVLPQVAWANPTGTQVIVLMGLPKPNLRGAVTAFLVTRSRITKIPEATWPGLLSASTLGAW
ncbi:MAG TPA: hypothetical protein VGM14_00225 [Streptosporangiaceae bacterium]|jgi:hypothetical protein